MTELAPGIPMPDPIVLEMSPITARQIAFVLQESYAKWGMEHDHWVRHENTYPQEVIEILDAIDVVRDQLTDQGVEWDPEL
jgi:hypothetical protein